MALRFIETLSLALTCSASQKSLKILLLKLFTQNVLVHCYISRLYKND